ncbi:endonuclease III [Candidatus Bathyarchaeota archaeon]|nr:endonuclease III [Candidatus Bathyarchaeota archaeon]NIU81712.1 endonuclease III [Candidatus Bathyarchaeota archaeon]NIV68360.1 endonuclease III [Candidatus Bathyarchaeota archaeon]NIW16439.1 endonuclease III [Candidatus Bathyarchaeota archaeon]NIW34302.1 endonuclease III [Candidatus Bathyarchaeota archaeon]
MNIIERAARILEELKRTFSLPTWIESPRKPFRTLIRTVLSQATVSKNTDRAFRNLKQEFQLTPEALAKADLEEIQEAIKVAGLFRNKSRAIKNISQLVLERFNGSLDFIHSLPLQEARRKLMDLPGVGPKTADVVLLFCDRRPVIPIDTHVRRVSGRLRLAPAEENYQQVREALQFLYPPQDYLPVHLLLISLGRKYCKARRPLCGPCPVSHLCPSKRVSDQ